jgi:transposase
MAMTIVETERRVTGGVDTHADVHMTAVVDHVGGVLGVEAFETTETGCQRLVGWLRSHGEVGLVGVEGTGSYGAGLARYLDRAGIEVVEVDRPNRQVRHREGKSDPVDAVTAARAALSGQALGRPKSRNGGVEAIRVLSVARRSATAERIVALNQLRHLCFTADDPIRRRFDKLSVARLTATAAAMKPRHADTVRHATLLAIRTLARRVRYLDAELVELTRVMKPLVERVAPGLLGMYGVGYDVAAKLLMAAGDNPERLSCEAAFANMCGVAPLEASSGKIVRHRLNRGGNREANNALYCVVITRLASHQPTKNYVARRRAEGKSIGEIVRVLKRYVAREAFKHLRPRPAGDTLDGRSTPIGLETGLQDRLSATQRPSEVSQVRPIRPHRSLRSAVATVG